MDGVVRMDTIKQTRLDPLYIIFEQHLYNFQNSDLGRKEFIDNVLQDYLSYLRKRKISVPKGYEGPIAEELFHQVHAMLVKKIYGCYSVKDFQEGAGWKERRRAKGR